MMKICLAIRFHYEMMLPSLDANKLFQDILIQLSVARIEVYLA